jgi:hypothetical protein
MRCDRVNVNVTVDALVDQFVVGCKYALIFIDANRHKFLDRCSYQNTGIQQCKLIENFIFCIEPVGLAPIVEHVFLKREQVFLRIGEDNDCHYLRR